MKIFNSSTQELVELNEQKITIYNCGPTVYNYVHIGNVRPLVIFDVLLRFLQSQKKEIIYVQNITDVDDKIIKAAAEQGISEKELTTKYTQAYHDMFQLLNIRPMIMPRVSDHINDIIEYIKKLVDVGAAYIVEGDVYFDISKAKDYGHVSRQNPKQLLDGVRKDNKTNKHSPLDFVLWKKTTEGINWESPWSIGRPGWHTECCVLINKFVGDHVTIHGGGVDLKFPHHENENAQNNAICNRDIADIWMHVGHINVDGSKMSKSLNNFILVKDIVNKDNANGLRWFFYKAKYEQPVNFSQNLLQEADKEIKAIIKSLIVSKTYLLANNSFNTETAILDNSYITSLNDDLNIPNAITAIQNQIKQINILIRNKDFNNANHLYFSVCKELEILGIQCDLVNHMESINLIKSWKSAVDNKQFDVADKARNQLIEKGLL